MGGWNVEIRNRLFAYFWPCSKKNCSFLSKLPSYVKSPFKRTLYISVCAIIIVVLESQTTLGHSARVMHKNQTLNWGWEKTGWFTLAGDVIRPQHARFQRPHRNIENDSAPYCCCFGKTGFVLTRIYAGFYQFTFNTINYRVIIKRLLYVVISLTFFFNNGTRLWTKVIVEG